MICTEERVETKVIREVVNRCDGCGARRPSDPIEAKAKGWIAFAASWQESGAACSSLCMVEIFGGTDARKAAEAEEQALAARQAADDDATGEG